MKTKILLIYFVALLILLMSGLTAGFYFFNHEKENVLHKALSLQQKNSLELITENVYGDLLIDNTMEVERKLNVMIEKKIIKSFLILKGDSAEYSNKDNQCKTIYFDKINQLGKWGIFCVDFSSEHLGNEQLSLKGVSVVVFSLAAFLVLIIAGIFKQISKLNLNLYKGVEVILTSNGNDISKDEIWSPVLNQLRDEVLKKKNAEKKLLKKQVEEKKVQIAHQVSHDIRSPLSVLKMVLKDIGNIEIEQRLLIENALDRINDISNNLLVSFKEKKGAQLDNYSLLELMEMIIAEKKYQYKDSRELEIIFEYEKEITDINVKIIKSDFHRMISNIFNNSVEAMSEKGIIKIKIELHDSFVVITLSDNGIGIPQEILSKIGDKGFSFGKDGKSASSGSGLGLFHAKETMKSYGGQFYIESKLHVGTTVSLSLPIIQQIEMAIGDSFYEYLLIDNDKIIRLAWMKRAKKANVRLLALSSISEFEAYSHQINKESTSIYLDSDLGEGSPRGEEFALILHQKGYKKLSMASSFEMAETYSWLKNSGKITPF